MKQYIKPTITTKQVSTQEVIAFSFFLGYDDGADTNYEVLSTKRRGTWGDLWYQGEGEDE